MRVVLWIVAFLLMPVLTSTASAASQKDVQEFLSALRAGHNKIITYEKFRGDEKGRKGGFLATYDIHGKRYRMTYDRYAKNCLHFVLDTDSDLDLVTLESCDGIVTAAFTSVTTDLHYSEGKEKGKEYRDFWQVVFDKALAESTAYFKR